MHLDMWAKKWKISAEALADLHGIFLRDSTGPESENTDDSEMAVQNRIRLEASRKGCRLWRNNVGAVHTAERHFIRFGLCNESKQINDKIKSADLVGIRPVIITDEMVGRTIGQFLSREIKPANWKFSGSDRETAQLRWAELITSLGGDACFANNEGTL